MEEEEEEEEGCTHPSSRHSCSPFNPFLCMVREEEGGVVEGSSSSSSHRRVGLMIR